MTPPASIPGEPDDDDRTPDAFGGRHTDDIDWDDVADVICVGGGLGVAMAGAARAAGLDVLLVEAGGSPTTGSGLAGLLGSAHADSEHYLRALTEEFDPVDVTAPDVPVRVVDGPSPAESRRTRLPTFHGAALRDWGSSCMAARYGLLYTRVYDPRLSATYTGLDGTVEVTVLATIELDSDRPGASVANWLAGLVDEEGESHGTLQHLVFDSGAVVGAALSTEDGVRLVRTRHGVMLSPLAAETDSSAEDLEADSTAEVALVSRAASRFGRLELLRRT